MKNRFSLSNAGKLRKAPSIYDKKKKKPAKKVTTAIYPPLQEDKPIDQGSPKNSSLSTPSSSRASTSNLSKSQSDAKRSQTSSTTKEHNRSRTSINQDPVTPQKNRTEQQKENPPFSSPNSKSETLRAVPRQNLPEREDLINEYEQLAKEYESELQKRNELQSENADLENQIAEAYKKQAVLERQCLIQND